MAKQIKAIKCPQCSSTEKTELKTDHFKCKKCGTEYFLDSDDITITHKVEYGNSKSPVDSKKAAKIALAAVGVFFGVMLLSILIPLIFRSGSSKNRMDDEKYRNSIETVAIKCNGKLYTLNIYAASSMSGNRTYYMLLREAETGKVTQKQKLSEEINSFDTNYKRFGNGKVYFVVNKRKIYTLDEATLELKDLTGEIRQKNTAFSAGIASVEFLYDCDAEGFALVSNMGEQFFYLPLADKIFEGEFSIYKFDTSDAVSRDSIFFAFAEDGNQRHNEKFRHYLVKSVIKANDWGAYHRPCFTEYKIENGKFRISRGNITDGMEIFTPDRPYFYQNIIYYDNEYLLISFRAVAVESTSYNLQLMNAKDGSVFWTKEYENPRRWASDFKSSERAGDKLLVSAFDRSFWLVDLKTGNWKVLDVDK